MYRRKPVLKVKVKDISNVMKTELVPNVSYFVSQAAMRGRALTPCPASCAV